ncbi:MAG: hypothetical protein II103_00160 [Treponema sp.]|nr:hypothetical protein [Treponema sp.]
MEKIISSIIPRFFYKCFFFLERIFKQIIGSWFDYAHQPTDNDPVCAKNWGSYAKQPGIRFGRNGKKNLDENPFARSERSERKSYYRRTWLLQTTHWILQPDFSGSGAQN